MILDFPNRKELQQIILNRTSPKDLDTLLIEIKQRLLNISLLEMDNQRIMLEISHLPSDFENDVRKFLKEKGYTLTYNICFEKYFVSWQF